MKLTQKQAIEAYTVIRKLEKQEMSGTYAMVLFKARKELEPHFQFQDEQEHKLIKQLGCVLKDSGEIEFPNAEARQKYVEKVNEIAEVEVELDLEKKEFDITDLHLSAKDIEALEIIADIVC